MSIRRTSRTDRITAEIVAEREIMRYADDHAAWHKHVHNVDLDPVQVLKCIEMDQHKYTIDNSCRRTGKTAIKELYLLKHNACNADQEVGIVAPREAQSLVNLTYHLEAIRRSPILEAFIGYRANRPQLADSYYEFTNRSRAEAYGIMAQVDGGDMTAASLEEVDDMPADRLNGRFLLMMASTRRLGASKKSLNDPQIRVTGVFKGADVLQTLIASNDYHLLPMIDVHLGMAMGLIQQNFILLMRSQLSHDEYIRQLLCINVSGRNFIWELHIRDAMKRGLKSGISVVDPLPGQQYRRRGVISFGWDAGGHGDKETSSKFALVVSERIGNFISIPFAYEWPISADDPDVQRDLIAFWRYFRPDTAWGDSYGVGLLMFLNDELYAQGLTDIDRKSIGDGQSSAHNWAEWAFKPIQFEGQTKHQMATALRNLFHGGRAVIPYFDDSDQSITDPVLKNMRKLVHQLGNIKKVPTKNAYDSYDRVNNKIGDDLFDAAMASVWGHVRMGTPEEPTVILHTSRNVRNLQ